MLASYLPTLATTPVGDTNIPDPIMEPTMKATPDQRPTDRFRVTSVSAEAPPDEFDGGFEDPIFYAQN